jgi:hypothetical protein
MSFEHEFSCGKECWKALHTEVNAALNPGEMDQGISAANVHTLRPRFVQANGELQIESLYTSMYFRWHSIPDLADKVILNMQTGPGTFTYHCLAVTLSPCAVGHRFGLCKNTSSTYPFNGVNDDGGVAPPFDRRNSTVFFPFRLREVVTNSLDTPVIPGPSRWSNLMLTVRSAPSHVQP